MAESVPAPAIPVCGIGASAGGIEALQQFFETIPNDVGIAYVVILHLAPDRRSELPDILRRWTSMPVTQVADHVALPLARDHVYVIAPNRRLEISDTTIGASPFDQPGGRRAAIDLFFRSLAIAHGDGFAVILSGTGSDGALGAKAIKEQGGLVLVQEPSEAAHEGMPRSVIATGAADLVLPVRELAAQVAQLAKAKADVRRLVSNETGALPDDQADALNRVLELLRRQTGHDFTKYKRATVMRRLSRRLQLARCATITDYLSLLRTNTEEVHALFRDFLISVTTFFRDAEAWEALRTQVVGPLIDRGGDQPIRAWVAGCATGEEAYSLAMLFHEEFDRRDVHPGLIVFASDVDDVSLAVARDGVYSQAIVADLGEARLARFFRPYEGHYRVVPSLRDSVVFASHSLLRDPPFSRLDLMTCRNVLIYLDRELQRQVMQLCRYACKDAGYLFLGASETADDTLFEAIDAKHRLYGATAAPEGAAAALPDITLAPATTARRSRVADVPADSRVAAQHLAALETASPPSVLVDDHSEVLHLSDSASAFFRQGGGPVARRVTDLVRPELRDELHGLLHIARETPGPHLSAFVPVPIDGVAHRVAILAQQRRERNGLAHLLLTFLDAGIGPVDATPPSPDSHVLRTLHARLQHAEQRIETMRDDNHLTNEDLRAANEELQSLNEEYRSTTEELETSKEELQSINEELLTVNHELKLKLDEVSRAHSDVENLMVATDVATLFLEPDLRIARFTPQLATIFNIRQLDRGRPIGDLTHRLDYPDLEADASGVLSTLAPVKRDVRSDDGRSFIVRLGPYSTATGKVDGVVMTFVDVTAIGQAEMARERERRLDLELRSLQHLHAMTLAAATAPSLTRALYEVLDSAIELHGADFGNVQLFDANRRQLHIVAHRGFEEQFLDHFRVVDVADESACGRALRQRAAVYVEDIDTDAPYEPLRPLAHAAGYRAVQSVPLVAADDAMVGVLSVHYREPHQFSERDRHVGDLIARQAAELVASRAQQDRVAELNGHLRARTTALEASRAELAQQAELLVEQDRHREQFLAALGHELRNPLSAIRGALPLIDARDERSSRALAVLTRQAAHMTRLINDLLDITRVKHGRLRLERAPVELNAAVSAAVEAVRPLAQGKNLGLDIALPEDLVIVDADAERIAQVLDNLLRNAVMYTDSGRVQVDVRAEGAAARVTVRDTGVGIDSEQAPALFNAYEAHDVSLRSGGLGLGLSVSKGLVEAHGGTLGFHSPGTGQGSAFHFTLPLLEMMPTAREATPPAAPARPRRVLVVDDQRDVADMFAALLEALGQEVRTAYSGADALAAADEHQPELAFLDIGMPDMSGTELARRLRSTRGEAPLTIVAVSGFSRTQIDAVAGPFDRHLLKPTSIEDVLEVLNLPLADVPARE